MPSPHCRSHRSRRSTTAGRESSARRAGDHTPPAARCQAPCPSRSPCDLLSLRRGATPLHYPLDNSDATRYARFHAPARTSVMLPCLLLCLFAAPEPALVEGKFGKALDAARTPLAFGGDHRYRTPPLTVECWAKLNGRRGFNVLVSCDDKASARHW